MPNPTAVTKTPIATFSMFDNQFSCVKHYSDPEHNGNIISDGGNQRIAARVEITNINESIFELEHIIEGMTDKNYLTIGVAANQTSFCVLKDNVVDEVKKHPNANIIARTDDFLKPAPDTGGLFVFDADDITESPYQDYITAMPGLADCELLEISSSSSNIYSEDGTLLKGYKGCHTYGIPEDPLDMPRTIEVAHQRMILAGLSKCKVGARGDFLERSAVDGSVNQYAKPNYETSTFEDGLFQDKQFIKHPGKYAVIDTRKVIPDLTDNDESNYQYLLEMERQRLAPEMAAKKAEWDAERLAQGVSQGTIDKVHATAGTRPILEADYIIYVIEKGKRVPTTVGVIVADPDKYNGMNCRDPIEEDYGSNTTARIFFNDNGQVIINSKAHGEQAYELVNDAKYIGAVFDQDINPAVLTGNAVAPTVPAGVGGTLTDRFFYIKTTNKFYEKKNGGTMSKDAFNQSEKGAILSEGSKPATAANTFKYLGGVAVNGITWKPCRYGNKPDELSIIEGKTLINEYRLPHDVVADPDDRKVERYIELLEYLIPDESIRNVYLDHMAFTMQHPEKKINWQIIFVGKTRIGKDFSLKPLSWYFGSMYQEFDPDDLEANKWGDMKARKKILTYQEIHQPGNRAFYNQLKTTAASTAGGMTTLNIKGGGQVTQLNLFSVYAMSNYPDAMHLDSDDERWFVIAALDIIAKDKAYYKSLIDWFEDDGCRLVSAWLLARDVSQFSEGRLPFHTKAKTNLIDESHSNVFNKLEDMKLHNEGIFNESIKVFTLAMVIEYLETKGMKRVNKHILARELSDLGIEKLKRAEQVINNVKKTAQVYRRKLTEGVDAGYDNTSPSELWSAYIESRKQLENLQATNKYYPPENNYIVDGKVYSESFLLASPGWDESHMANLQKA